MPDRSRADGAVVDRGQLETHYVPLSSQPELYTQPMRNESSRRATFSIGGPDAPKTDLGAAAFTSNQTVEPS
jgi:hypothetical protein